MSFLFSIVNSARNWVDSLQAMVPGYRDRIAHIFLDANEGGLNLTMPIEVVTKVAGTDMWRETSSPTDLLTE